jgi:hypothetical protein
VQPTSKETSIDEAKTNVSFDGDDNMNHPTLNCMPLSFCCSREDHDDDDRALESSYVSFTCDDSLAHLLPPLNYSFERTRERERLEQLNRKLSCFHHESCHEWQRNILFLIVVCLSRDWM